MEELSKEKIRYLKEELRKRRLAEPLVKKRYKMYKSKGRWLVAAILFLSIGAGGATTAYAREITGAQVADAGTSVSSSDEASATTGSSLTEKTDEGIPSSVTTESNTVTSEKNSGKISLEDATENVSQEKEQTSSVDIKEDTIKENGDSGKKTETSEITRDDKNTSDVTETNKDNKEQSTDISKMETPNNVAIDETIRVETDTSKKIDPSILEEARKLGFINLPLEDVAALVLAKKDLEAKGMTVDDLIRTSALNVHSNSINVSTADQLIEALTKGSYHYINVMNDIDLEDATDAGGVKHLITGIGETHIRGAGNRSFVLNGNNHTINFGGIAFYYEDGGKTNTNITVENMKVYGRNCKGFIGSFHSSARSHYTVTFRNVDYTGAQLTDSLGNATVVFEGHNDIKAVGAYTYGGKQYICQHAVLQDGKYFGREQGLAAAAVGVKDGSNTKITTDRGPGIWIHEAFGGNRRANNYKLIIGKGAKLDIEQTYIGGSFGLSNSNVHFTCLNGAVEVGEGAKFILTAPKGGAVPLWSNILFTGAGSSVTVAKDAQMIINGLKKGAPGTDSAAYVAVTGHRLDIQDGAKVEINNADVGLAVFSGAVVNVHAGAILDIKSSGNSSHRDYPGSVTVIGTGKINVYGGGTLNVQLTGMRNSPVKRRTDAVHLSGGGRIFFGKGAKGLIANNSQSGTAFRSDQKSELIIKEPESVEFRNENDVATPIRMEGVIRFEKGRIELSNGSTTVKTKPIAEAQIILSNSGERATLKKCLTAQEVDPALVTKDVSRIVSDIPNSKRVIFTAAGTQDVKVDIADDNQITNQTTVITGTSTPYAYITLTDINGTILKNINATLSGNDYITAGRYVTQADGSGSWKIELNQSLDSGSVFVAEAAYGWKTAKDVAYVYNTQVSKNIEEIKQVQQNAQDLYDNGKGGLSYKTEFNKGKLQTINQAVTDALTAQSGYSMAAENAVRHARQYLEKLADANAAREIGAVEEAKALMQEAAEYLKNTNQELQVALNKSEEIIQKSAVAWTAYKEMKPDQLSVDVKAADEAVKKAEEAGKEAQAAHNAAQQVLNEAKKDGLITPTEQAAIQQANKAVDDANAKVESTKKAAQDLVSALPESVKDDKDKLQKRLDAVQPATKVEVPEVTEYREVPDYGIIYTDQMGYNTIYSRNRKRLTRLVEQELPETGSKESANLTAIGLLMASLGLSSFVAGHRKKREK